MTDTLIQDLVRRLVDMDPWCRSSEGIDDCCHFCGCHAHDYNTTSTARAGESTASSWATDQVYKHLPDCSWLEAATVYAPNRVTGTSSSVPYHTYTLTHVALSDDDAVEYRHRFGLDL